MNRRIAIVPLFFASLMLLAHLFVPHHHHHGTIFCILNFSNELVAESLCFDTHHNDHKDETNSERSDSHRKNENESEENCFMDDLYIVSETKQSVDFTKIDISESGFSLILAVLVSTYEPAQFSGLPYRGNPYPIFYISLFDPGVRGSRAPPVC